MTMTRRTVLTTAAALAAASWSGLAASAEKSKSIVIFFSRTGTIKGLAQTVVKLTGADVLELQLVKPYAAAGSGLHNKTRRSEDFSGRTAQYIILRHVTE